ncbi:hypothetical protein [Methyloterricola oryzae]|uniref:hypothetical protein n=1 Tax=Methyloterricola oryzae TaxID=1495050 RepID=UPI0005EAF069|nr:hypothetical protein [Methyloterricola oryzae]
MHYAFLRQNRSGWAWPVDEDKPAGLFLDRMLLTGKIGGRMDLDAAFFVNGDGMEPVANQVEARRWRIHTSGDATLRGRIFSRCERLLTKWLALQAARGILQVGNC